MLGSLRQSILARVRVVARNLLRRSCKPGSLLHSREILLQTDGSGNYRDS
ncbi:MAG: hypothetical protein H6965_14730 [Chromatiaceae bacterium]|nr:hypothetical protein [Chromatiaceae bacterium]